MEADPDEDPPRTNRRNLASLLFPPSPSSGSSALAESILASFRAVGLARHVERERVANPTVAALVSGRDHGDLHSPSDIIRFRS